MSKSFENIIVKLICSGNDKLADSMIKSGADTKIADSSWRNALDLAIKKGSS